MNFIGNIENKTLKNDYYRKVLSTTKQSQLVLMSLLPGEEIGIEKHKGITQFIRVESGKGIAIIDEESKIIKNGYAVFIPSGSFHNIINTSKTEKLKLYTLYSPPAHPPNMKAQKK